MRVGQVLRAAPPAYGRLKPEGEKRMKVKVTVEATFDVSMGDATRLLNAKPHNLASAVLGANDIEAVAVVVDAGGEGPGQGMKGLVNRCLGRN
jgi:hypothetical protein